MVYGERVFDPQWIRRFDRLTEADGTARIKLPGAMHRQIDIFAGCIPKIGVAFADLAKYRTVQGLHERIPTATIAAAGGATPATASAGPATASFGHLPTRI